MPGLRSRAMQAVLLLAAAVLAGCSGPSPSPGPTASPTGTDTGAASPTTTEEPRQEPVLPASWKEPLAFSGSTAQTACVTVAGQAQCTAPGGASVHPLEAQGTPTHLNLTVTWDGGPAGLELSVLFGWIPEGDDHYAYSDELTATGPSPLAIAWPLDLPASTGHGIVVSSSRHVDAVAGSVIVVPEVAFEASGDWSGRAG